MTLIQNFWWLLTMAAVGWYLTVTVYVAVRGVTDILHMLARLRQTAMNDKDHS